MSEEVRALGRRYREERAQILADESISWEKRMFAIKEVFDRYAAERDELLRRAAEEDGAA